MTFRDFIDSLDEARAREYAEACGTTPKYLHHQLKYRYRVPRADLMDALWQNSSGRLTKQDVLNHFYSRDGGEAA